MATRLTVAVIVHYGDAGRSIRAVVSHSSQGAFSNIVVVANDLSSRPEELADVKCIWLVPDRNLGFGGACQLGAQACQADVYAFFNPHVTIDRSSVDACLSAFGLDNVGIAAPYLYHPGTKNPAIDWRYAYCTRTYSRFVRMPIQVPLPAKPARVQSESSGLIDNDWATGGAIFCRAEVVREVGWDGSFFLGFEDVDISLRAKNRGWRVVVVPSAIAYHTGESTRESSLSPYYAMRNAIWFARRHRDRRVQALLTTYLSMLLCRIALADCLKARRPFHARPAARGIWHGWSMLPRGPEALYGEPLVSSRR